MLSVFLALIIVLFGFLESDRMVRFSLAILIFSTYLPGFTIITSPETELLTAVCMNPLDRLKSQQQFQCLTLILRSEERIIKMLAF
jgi:hypothetical protein